MFRLTWTKPVLGGLRRNRHRRASLAIACSITYDKRENGLWANTGRASSKTRRFVPIEVRIVAEKKEAFQSFGLDEHFAGYPLLFDPEIIDEPVDGPDNVAAHHLVASGLLDIPSDGFGK